MRIHGKNYEAIITQANQLESTNASKQKPPDSEAEAVPAALSPQLWCLLSSDFNAEVLVPPNTRDPDLKLT